MPRLGDKADRTIDVAIGRRIKLRRRLLNLSQEQVAKKLGITFQQLQKYENGENRLVASRLYRLAFALRASVDYFFEDFPLPENVSLGLPSDDPRLSDESLSRQGVKLMRAFSRVSDPKMRRHIADLVAQMAESTLTSSDNK